MADDSLVEGLKDIIRKYMMLFPFVRKDAFAELTLNPSAALPREMGSSSIGKGFRDAIIPAYFSTILALIAGFVVELAIPTAGLGTSAILQAYGLIALITLIALPLAVIIGMAFNAAVYVAAARLLDAKQGEFRKTMGMLGTIQGPVYLLGIVPRMLSVLPVCGIVGSLAGAAVGIYQLYLNFRMIKGTFGLGDWKSIAVLLSPIALVVILVIALVIVLVATGVGAAALLSYMNGMATGLPSS